jgi:hypothetical protein
MLRPTIASLTAALAFTVCPLLFVSAANAALTTGKCLVLQTPSVGQPAQVPGDGGDQAAQGQDC